MKPYYQHAGITIYHGDCREVLPTLTEKVDLVLTDPPYGMNWNGEVRIGPNGTGGKAKSRNYGVTIQGDDKPFDPLPLIGYSKVVIWGFHHMSSRLPEGSMLVWLKRYDSGFGSFLSDADTAWMKGGCGVYCVRDVSLQGESSTRVHPCQKPVSLMLWCLKQAKATGLVLDPYMGSGTVLVAAKQYGLPATGIEIEERYCEIAAKRLAQEVLPF